MGPWGDTPIDYRVGPVLRDLVREQEFDYGVLVAGVHQRAGRIRRRRAIVTGSLAAAVVPALGSAALVLPGVLGGPDGSPPPVLSTGVAGPGGSVTTLDEDAVVTLEDGASVTTLPEDASPLRGEPDRTVVQTPPWQDGELSLPQGGVDRTNSANAWEVPDARPSGVDYLAEFGAPQRASEYARIAPVEGAMECNTGAEDASPLAGQSWSYFHDEGGSAAGSAYLHVTGWQDSRAAFEAIRDDTMTYCVRSVEWQQVPWEGHQDAADSLLYEAADGSLRHGFAVVRQGDYLIAVTVTDESGAVNAAVAAETADKMAQNMAALDPAHGRD